MLRSVRNLSIKANSEGALSKLSVVINNAGSKTSPKSGLSHLLSNFYFLNNASKSGLRFTRESELLGGHFSSSVSRDSITLEATFLKENLPFYVNSLADALTPSFRPHELSEIVLPLVLTQTLDNRHQALELLHSISFKRGYGNSLYYNGNASISIEDIAAFNKEVINSSNISIFASGVDEADLNRFVEQSNFSKLSGGSSSSGATPAFTVGKEARISASGPSVAQIGIPIKKAQFGAFESLSVALGNYTLQSANTPLAQLNAVSNVFKYQDAGLFVVNVSGNAQDVATNIKKVKSLISSVKTDDVAKLAELSLSLQSTLSNPLDIKVDTKKPEIKDFNYVAVGDLDVLPYSDEL